MIALYAYGVPYHFRTALEIHAILMMHDNDYFAITLAKIGC